MRNARFGAQLRKCRCPQRRYHNADAERLSTLLTKLPALESIRALSLRAQPGAAAAATQDLLAGAARAVGCCPCLRSLDLRITLADRLADRVPGTVWLYLAKARALSHLKLTMRSAAHGGSATTSASQSISGLAGLSRLRTLRLKVDNVCEDTLLPACVSRLVQLNFLTLYGLSGRRCAPGWARLPALERLKRSARLRAAARTRCPAWTRWPR